MKEFSKWKFENEIEKKFRKWNEICNFENEIKNKIKEMK